MLTRPLFDRLGARGLLLDPADTLAQAGIPLLSPIMARRERAAAARRAELIKRHGEPLVSVVMPAWNASETIAAAAQSILQQSYRALELIIVDDASSDTTLTMAKDLARADDRVRVIASPRQNGAARARNRGLSHVAGQFVTFQDADDISHPERLERQVAELLGHPSAMVCVCNCRREDRDGNVVAINGRHVSKAVMVMMFRSDPVLPRLGYLVAINVSEDAEYYERIKAVFGDDCEVLLPQLLYYQRFSPSSLLFSDGTTTAANNAVTHTRSADAEADLERVREHHRRIRSGHADPYVAFDPEL